MALIESNLAAVARQYPPHMVAAQLADIPRIAFCIRLALGGRLAAGLSICDLGGGVGLFAPGCVTLGMVATLIDDFADPTNLVEGDRALAVHRAYRVRVIARDVVAQGLEDLEETFDIVTSFDSMEHWHHSPKALFRQISKKLLNPGGRFVLGVPNCVNLRKRLTVPFGAGKWSPMSDWYEQRTFRGHVREPDVDDLLYIARDMELEDVRVIGRNWLGHSSRSRLVRYGTRLADKPLQRFPQLCSDIYLTGTVPHLERRPAGDAKPLAVAVHDEV